MAARPPRRRRAQGDARRRPAAHRQRRGLARRLLRARGGQGLPRVVVDHRLQGRPDVAGLRPGAALPQDGRARRPPRLVGVPQGRQRRLHPGAGPGRGGVRRRDPARRPGHVGADRRRPCRRRRARGRHGVPRAGRGLGAGPAAYLPRAGRAPRAPARPGRQRAADEVPRRLGQGQLRPRRAAGLPGAARTPSTTTAASSTSARPSSTSSGPSTPRSTAGTPSGRSSTPRSSRWSTPTWRRPASTSCRASCSTRRTS